MADGLTLLRRGGFEIGGVVSKKLGAAVEKKDTAVGASDGEANGSKVQADHGSETGSKDTIVRNSQDGSNAQAGPKGKASPAVKTAPCSQGRSIDKDCPAMKEAPSTKVDSVAQVCSHGNKRKARDLDEPRLYQIRKVAKCLFHDDTEVVSLQKVGGDADSVLEVPVAEFLEQYDAHNDSNVEVLHTGYPDKECSLEHVVLESTYVRMYVCTKAALRVPAVFVFAYVCPNTCL